MSEKNLPHLLTVFLPYNTSSITKTLKMRVNEYFFLITNLLNAIQLLQERSLHHFDALVGDNGCHIRALKISASFYSCLGSFSKKLSKIEQFKKIIEQLLLGNEIQKQGSLDEFLTQHQLIIRLTEDELYLFGCYFLTITKKELHSKAEKPLVLNNTTTPLALKNLGKNISGQFSRNLVNHLRKRIAASSVEYMRQEAHFVSCKEIASMMISPKQTIFHNNQECISIFWSTLILKERALSLGLPIILIAEQKASDCDHKTINNASILLKPTAQGYYMVDYKNEDLNQVGIVIKGITCRPLSELPSRKKWIQELLNYQPMDLFLAYSAKHCQLPDPSKDYLITRFANPKMEDYYQKSINWGCCLDNPSLFFITHVYSQKIGNIQDLETLVPSSQKLYRLAVA